MPDSERRIEKVSNAIAELGHEDITKFDYAEPEYKALSSIFQKLGNEKYLALLGISAGIIDYQLAGTAQLFWKDLKQTALQHDQLQSYTDIEKIMENFMNKPINARLRNRKKGRLKRLLDSKFPKWFIENYEKTEASKVWSRLAQTLNNKMNTKTIVFSMKVYDLVNLLTKNEYLDLPNDIPIPCDVHVKRVAKFSGMLEGEEDDDTVRSVWEKVSTQVSDQVGINISLLRIDSIVWQLGQVASANRENKRKCISALNEYLENLGIEKDKAEKLSSEITYIL